MNEARIKELLKNTGREGIDDLISYMEENDFFTSPCSTRYHLAAHTQTDHDEAGYMFTRIKTSGKKLDKICLESKFTTVLLSKCVDGAYKFETQANNSTAKSPMGAFDQMEIDNDIVEVMKALEDY